MPEPQEVTTKTRAFYEHMRIDLNRAPTTATVRRTIVSSTLREFGTLEPTHEQVEARRRKMLLEGATRDHARNFVYAFRDYFAFIGRPDTGHVLRVPPKEKARVPRYLTEDEVRQFLSVVTDARDLALFHFLAGTGLRCHEILKVKPTDVDLDARTVTITGKGGKSSVISIAAHAVPHLRAYLELRDARAPTLFYARRAGASGKEPFGRMSNNRMRVLSRGYGRKAGLRKGVSPHMFRHALATNLLENGCPLPFVQRQLRHSDIKTTMIYLHASDKAYRQNFDTFVPQYG